MSRHRTQSLFTWGHVSIVHCCKHWPLLVNWWLCDLMLYDCFEWWMVFITIAYKYWKFDHHLPSSSYDFLRLLLSKRSPHEIKSPQFTCLPLVQLKFYLVCCKQTQIMGNQKIQNTANDFLSKECVHDTAGWMRLLNEYVTVDRKGNAPNY